MEEEFVRDGSEIKRDGTKNGEREEKEHFNKRRKEVMKMPGGDGSGPMGMGPMTGRAAGYCTGYPAPGFMSSNTGRAFGRGFGRGIRGGRGWGGSWGGAYAHPYGAAYRVPSAPDTMPYGFNPGPNPEQETDMLKGQAEYLENALKDIKNRIAELKAETEK